MVKTTKEQRQSIYRVFTRDADGALSYREFRKRIVPTIGCDGAVALPWCGMWLAIEQDGYTHS